MKLKRLPAVRGVTSYPRQGFLYGDHILLHHHHQLDALFVTHCDLAGNKTDVIACRVKRRVSWDFTISSDQTYAVSTYPLTSAAPLPSATFGTSAKKTCSFSFHPIFLWNTSSLYLVQRRENVITEEKQTSIKLQHQTTKQTCSSHTNMKWTLNIKLTERCYHTREETLRLLIMNHSCSN